MLNRTWLRHRKIKIFMLLERIPVRIRLSLGHAIWMGLIFVGIGIGVYRVVEDSLIHSLDTTLLTSARTIRNMQLSRGRTMSMINESPYWELFFSEFLSGERITIRSYAQLVDMSGKVKSKTRNVWANLPVTPLAVERAEKGLETFETFHLKSDVILRQITLPIVWRGRFTGELVQVGAPMDLHLHTLESVQHMLWITLLLGLGISVIFGYLLTRWSFKPVARITRAASRLGVNDLDLRLRLPPASDELRILTKTFNEMLDRLEDAFSRLRRFAGDVSHELRTPLAVLRGEAELALRRDRTPEEYREALRTIAREAQSMTTIVEDLLLLARAQGNSIALKWEDVDTIHFLKELENSVKAAYEAKKIALTIENSGPPLIRLSPGYFSLALKNILLNACKHSASGSRVELKLATFGGYIVISIQDFGEGIPKESLPYIFDPFYRADTARNRSAGGAGIGLSLAMALVKLHKGEIKVASEEGKGACFTVKVPHGGVVPVSSEFESDADDTPLLTARVREIPNGDVQPIPGKV